MYRIELPGPPNIGEGKPENQNHAIIFTRGEALQTIDMNQVCGIKKTSTIKTICVSHIVYVLAGQLFGRSLQNEKRPARIYGRPRKPDSYYSWFERTCIYWKVSYDLHVHARCYSDMNFRLGFESKRLT